MKKTQEMGAEQSTPDQNTNQVSTNDDSDQSDQPSVVSGTLKDMYYLDTKSGNVYWNNQMLQDVHPRFFMVLSSGYAMDSWNAFYHEKKLDGVNVKEFKVTRDGNATDGKLYFKNGEPYSPETTNTKEEPRRHYKYSSDHDEVEIDMFNCVDRFVHWGRERVAGKTHCDLFVDLGGNYGRDYWFAYYKNKILPDAKPEAFSFDRETNRATDIEGRVFVEGKQINHQHKHRSSVK
jgi:hypothetical protein